MGILRGLGELNRVGVPGLEPGLIRSRSSLLILLLLLLLFLLEVLL